LERRGHRRELEKILPRAGGAAAAFNFKPVGKASAMGIV
jgi:hypothetical protein